MLFGKKKKAKKHLEELWRSMEMACENNYKDLAQEELKEFESVLRDYAVEGLVHQVDCQKYKEQLEKKKQELTGYDHKQHIGW